MVDIQGATLKSFTTYLAERTASTTGVSMVPGLNTAESAVARVPVKTIYAVNYGVVADGVTDDTTAMNAAFAAAALISGQVVLPPGSIVYNGTGWNTVCPQIVGDGPTSTIVILGATSRLIDSNQAWGTLRLEKLRTSGGYGAIRNTFTGTNVSGNFFVHQCEFRDYTLAAIESNVQDQPNWSIEGNVFHGANYTTCMGVALAGWADSNKIIGNQFLGNKIHVKLGRSAQNGYIERNDFLRFATGTERIDIWVVPSPSSEFQTSGQGFTVETCKFGNEFLDNTDYRVLYADQAAGTNFGERLPVYTESTGYITGHSFDNVEVFSTDAWPNAFITSTTKNVFGCNYGTVRLGGAFPRYLFKFLFAPTNLKESGNNVFGPVLANFTQYNSTMRFSFVSHPGTGRIMDPTGLSAMYDHDVEMPFMNRGTASYGAGFLQLWASAATSAGANGTCTKSTQTDPDGGANSVRGTFTAGAGNLAFAFATLPVANVPIWIEFDIGPGSSPLAEVELGVYLAASPFTKIFAESLIVPAAARRVRRIFQPKTIPAGNFSMAIANQGNLAGTVDISRVLIYQAREPLMGNVQLLAEFMAETNQVPGTPTGGIYRYNQGGNLYVKSATATQEIAGRGRYYYSSTIFSGMGSGSPEGVITAGIGSTWHRSDGGAGTSFYVKESGAGNTGWVAK